MRYVHAVMSHVRRIARVGAWGSPTIVVLLLSFAPAAHSACVDAPPGAVAWWALDEQNGPTAYDSAGQNNGNYANEPTPTPGYVRNALLFDGVDDHILVPDDDSLDFGTGDFSIEAWVKLPEVTGIRPLVDKLSPSTKTGYSLSFVQGNAINFVMGDNNGYFFVNAPGVADNVWTHVAVTVDRDMATGGTVYVNGSVVLSFSPTFHSGSISNGEPIRIGQGGFFGNGFYGGAIDELALYDRTLQETEVQGLYMAGAEGKCLPLSCNMIQNYDRNLRKYWRYRDRFNNAFTVLGVQCGNSLPAAARGGDSWVAPVLQFGDAVLDMGYYLGVLATEYRLLKDYGQDTSATEQELYYALQELNRLDAFAESAWTEYLATGDLDFCAAPADLNGFLIRDERGNDFVNVYGPRLNAQVGRLNVVHVDRTEQIVRPTELSQDHLYSLMTGLALTTKLVDLPANYGGVHLVQESRNITTRVVNHIKSHQWIITNPIRNRCVFGISHACWAAPPDPLVDTAGYLKCCSDGGAVTLPYSLGLAEAANKIVYGFTPGISAGPFHDFTTFNSAPVWIMSTLVWAPPRWHGQNFVLQLSAVGDSIFDSTGFNLTVPRLNLVSKKEDREHIPLIHHVLYNRGHFISNEQMECMIDSAPCSGPFGRLYGRAGPYEWCTNNRFQINLGERSDPRVIDRCKEYYGLDFMLLYNLYRLVNPGQGPVYQRLVLPPDAPCDYCDSADDVPSINCNCLSSVAQVPICKQFCRTHKRECKEVCQSEKKVCKTSCTDERQVCFDACDSAHSGRPAKRTACRLGCRWKKLVCKIACTVEKIGCKQVCREEFRDCKTVCTDRTLAERIQYCRDIAVRSDQGLYSCDPAMIAGAGTKMQSPAAPEFLMASPGCGTEIGLQAEYYTHWLDWLLQDSLYEFNEVFSEFYAGDSDLDEFTDAVTQVAAEMIADIEESREDIDDALASIEEDEGSSTNRVPVLERFLRGVRPYITVHEFEISTLLQHIDTANATIDPTSSIASDILLRARWLLYENTLGFPPGAVRSDFDQDGDVDLTDLIHFEACATGPSMFYGEPSCADRDLDLDLDIDQSDFGRWQRCYSGSGQSADPACEDVVLTEACCSPNSPCVDLPRASCLSQSGSPQGPCSSCSLTSCESSTVACCMPGGNCIQTEPELCLIAGGLPLGAGTDCLTAACPQAQEACCLSDGTCADLAKESCLAQEGSPQGPLTACPFAFCPGPIQACYLSDGTCAELVRGVCLTQGGSPQGPGTTCTPQPPGGQALSGFDPGLNNNLPVGDDFTFQVPAWITDTRGWKAYGFDETIPDAD
jgi:hypothetical protein